MKRLIAVLAAVTSLLAATAALAATKTVQVDDNVFRPSSTTVKKGTTVRWRFVGDNQHNVRVTAGPVTFRSRTMKSGTFSKKLRRKGRYRIVCTIHPGMDMRLRVR